MVFCAEKCPHETPPCDIEILGIFIQEFLLKPVTRGNMHHIVDEQVVDGEFVTVTLHEYSLLAIHGQVTILFFLDIVCDLPRHVAQELRQFFKTDTITFTV
jgi:hypothetical protein